MAKAPTTILLITADRIARGDFNDGQCLGVWQDEVPATEDISLLVDSAMRLSPYGA